jgi:formate-dependent nitrite reductase membrane component NrfD
MPISFNKKKYAVALFFETGLGIISAALAIYGLVFVANNATNTYGMWTEIEPWMWNASFTFWVCYLIFSFFIIFLGIYELYLEKNFDKRKLKGKIKKNLKAPMR